VTGYLRTEDGGRLLAESGGALLAEVGVSGTWFGSSAAVSGFFFPYPAARPLQVAVTNTSGDWLFAVIAWRPSVAGDVSVCVADDAHNWWEPVGAGGAAAYAEILDTTVSPILDTTGSPILDTSAAGSASADSPASGALRVAVWAAPAARVANSVTGVTNVQVTPTGPVLSVAAVIVDMSNLLPWYQVAAIDTAAASAVTSLSVSAPAPPAWSLLFSGFAGDNNTYTISWPAGWNAIAGVTASNGADHTADITLVPAWQLTSASASASSTATGTIDMAGVIAGVLVRAPQPAQPSSDWPVMITEAAIGAGVQTPPSELTWTDISSRTLKMSMRQGRQYSLSQLAAGQGALELDNPDGALIPPGTGAFGGIDSGTPVRRRVIIPAAPNPHYVAVSGYFRRWPWQMDESLYRGKTAAEIVDAWAYAAVQLNSMAIEECLLDQPRSLWPLTDPAGSTAGSNLAPGNSLQLAQVASKYGTGSATAVFGGNSGVLKGANGAKTTASGASGGSAGMWQQVLSGNSLAYNGYGYALQCTDTAFPSLTAGVTAEVFAESTLSSTLSGISGNGLLLVAAAGGTFNTAQSNFPAGMPVVLGILSGSSLPTPFTAGTTYYVTAPDGQGNYSLAATQGGSAITTTSSGVGTIAPLFAWNPVILQLRDGKGTVAGLSVRASDGALLLLARTASGVTSTVVSTGGQDYRISAARGFSLALTQTAWQVFVDGGGTLAASGTFAAPLPVSFREICFGGVQDAVQQGYAFPGYFGYAAVYPGFAPQARVNSRRWATAAGMSGEAACDRIERVLEYAGLAGRRWLGQQVIPYEGDLCASGSDMGGQAAASSAGNIAQSTLPAMLYVAGTGDITYLSKFYTWNQPVRWVLGTRPDLGEIPFTPGSVATDYDPSRVVEDVQLTGLDSQLVTLPSGATASTTMAAVAAATERQYGGTAYQQTCYLDFDASSQYTAGSSALDLANWLAVIYRRPASRVQTVTVEAAANSANNPNWLAWQFWAGVSPGDMVQVNVRVPTAVTSPLITLVARVTQVQRSSQFSTDGTSAPVTCALDFAPESSTLTCDDPVRGLLNGSNVLGW
jgi:hypothetical protein